jgi:proteasome accessory factor C
MPPVAKYAQRIGRLPTVLELLAAHPDGLVLADLAARFGVPPEELREDLLAYYTADVGVLLLGLSRPDVLEVLGPDGRSADPNSAEIVRVIDERPTEELGVEYVDPSELALVYAAARALLDIEPDNAHLAGAVEVLTETMFGEPLLQSAPRSWNEPLPPFRRAIAEHLKVDIVYSRAWLPGVTHRTIEPYRLGQTRRGWEVDAGPPDAEGRLRTFLLPNVRKYDVLDEIFTAPPELESMLEQQRATETVRVQIPHAALWAADFFAERVSIVDDDATTATLDLELLPPVDQRVGLLVLAAGENARVLKPSGLIAAGPVLASDLLTHHRRDLA